MVQYIKNSAFINILLLALLVVLGYAAFSMASQAILVMREAKSVNDSLGELEAKEKELELAHAELNRPEAVEREAKERLNLKFPGEKVVVVVPEGGEEGSETQGGGFWNTIQLFLFSFFRQ